jgi:glyoxylate reductase
VGRIGTAFALKSKGFNMNVIYVDSRVNDVLELHLNAQKVDLPALLQESDFISLHVPLTKDTHHLIGEKELKMMKKTAILINTSRGPVVDEKALARSLKKKWIFGAGLDVYEHEPLIYDELKTLHNIVLQPHSASATVNSRTQMAILAAENMIEGLHGRIPPNCVNVEVFKK